MDHAEAVRLRLQRLAWLLDSSLRLPGTRFTVGVDALLGLIPGLGDAAGVVLSSYIVHEAWRLGAPKSVLLRMCLNIVVEGVVGAIPIAGDLFDAAWKANQRNVALLEAHLHHPRRAAKGSRALIVGLVVTVVAVAAAALALGGFVVAWLMNLARA